MLKTTECVVDTATLVCLDIFLPEQAYSTIYIVFIATVNFIKIKLQYGMKGECALTCTKGHLIRSTGQMSELTLHTKHEIVINTYHLDRQTTDSPVAGHPSL